MRFWIGLFTAIVVLFGPSPCGGQGTFQWTVSFDGPLSIAPDEDLATSYYSEEGMVFTPIGMGQFGLSGGGIPQRPYNGTAFFVSAFSDSLAVTGPPRFGLVSVDLAE